MARERPSPSVEFKATTPKSRDENTASHHPRSGEICNFFREELAKVKAGMQYSLPTNIFVANTFDAHRVSIPRILGREEGLLEEVRIMRKSLTKSSRAVTILENNATDVEDGVASQILSYAAVGGDLRMNKQTVAKAVKKDSDLQESLRTGREKTKQIELEQSSELAWFLGMMIGGGRIDNESMIIFTSKNEHVLQEFRNVGESLFKISGIDRKEKRETETSSITFNSRKYARLLGDFHMRERHTTIQEAHDWAIESPFINSFVSGLLDSGATITLKSTRRNVEFFTTHPEIGDFYRMVLIRLGMEKVRIGRHADKKRIKGVAIATMNDLRKFADCVTSVNPTTQQQLEEMKVLKEKKKIKPPIGSIGDVIEEWRRLTEILHHPPTSSDIISLREREETPYAASIYSRFFGGEKSKFSTARNNLETIVLDEEDHVQILLDAERKLEESDNYRFFLAKQHIYP